MKLAIISTAELDAISSLKDLSASCITICYITLSLQPILHIHTGNNSAHCINLHTHKLFYIATCTSSLFRVLVNYHFPPGAKVHGSATLLCKITHQPSPDISLMHNHNNINKFEFSYQLYFSSVSLHKKK